MENKNKEEVLKKLDELIDLIKNTPNYKRYDELKKSLEKNDEVMSLINDIKKQQKDIINKEYKKIDTKNNEKELSRLKEELNKYPNYLEYTYLQEDLNNDFQYIKKIIEDSINN